MDVSTELSEKLVFLEDINTISRFFTESKKGNSRIHQIKSLP